MSKEAKRPTRKGWPNHPIEFKRRLAQQACEGGVLVSRLTLEHGINAILLFKWRRYIVPDEVIAAIRRASVRLVSRESTTWKK